MLHSKRWVVNYTKHVHRKRKVYHDGILELNISSKKVMLYDDAGKLLDTMFLKKDEVVEYGGTVAFESHLVDIGELHIDRNPPKDSRVSVSMEMARDEHSSKEMVSKKNRVLGQKTRNIQYVGDTMDTRSEPMQSSVKEWDALYTTQVTQKAKRYHDGVLRLQACGSQMNQLTLLSEEETVLASKYLTSTDFLKTGVAYELSSYLVQICDSRNCQQQAQKRELDESGTSVLVPAVKPMQLCKIENKGKFLMKKPLLDEFKKDFSKEQLLVNNAGGWRGHEAAETLERKPLRDVFQILSNLRGRNRVNQREVPVEVQSEHAIKIASDVHCQSYNIKAPEYKYVGTKTEGGSLAESEVVRKSNGAQTTSANTCPRSPTSETISVQHTTVSLDHSQREDSNVFQALPCTLSTGSLQASNSGFVFSNKTNMNQEALESKSLSSCSLPNDGLNDCISSKSTADTCHMKCTPQTSSESGDNGPSGTAVQRCVEDEVSKECYARETTSSGEGFNQATLVNSQCPNNSFVNMNSSKKASGGFSPKSRTKSEDVPTFDLGF